MAKEPLQLVFFYIYKDGEKGEFGEGIGGLRLNLRGRLGSWTRTCAWLGVEARPPHSPVLPAEGDKDLGAEGGTADKDAITRRRHAQWQVQALVEIARYEGM